MVALVLDPDSDQSLPDFSRPRPDFSHLDSAAIDTAQRIYRRIRDASDRKLEDIASRLASVPDAGLFGQTEFEIRDAVHDIGADAFQTAFDERKKGGTKGPARPVRIASNATRASSTIGRRTSSPCSAESTSNGPITTAGTAVGASSPATGPWAWTTAS